jgi:hypothetical protein
MKGKRHLTFALVLIILSLSVPLSAVPRIQSYIVGSIYEYNTYGLYPGTDAESWLMASSTFDYRAVGYWQPAGGPAPAYDQMDVYVMIGVPKGETGRIWIDGVEITGFDNMIPADVNANPSLYEHDPVQYSDFKFVALGQVDNAGVNAYNYDHGMIYEPGWGSEITVSVTVEGYRWVHFDAIGIDLAGQTFVNPYSHDATMVPEPGTLSLLGIGLLGMVPLLRRKKR